MPATPPVRGGTVFRDAIQKSRGDKAPLLQSDIAKKLGVSAGYISTIFQGQIPCPRKYIQRLADLFFPSNTELRRIFVQEVAASNKNLQTHPGSSALFRIRMLSYGYLKAEEFQLPAYPPNLSGPSGFLVDCFTRLVSFTGQSRLALKIKKVQLRDVLSSTIHAGDVVLSHLAALNMVRTAYFFCTPISIGIGGLLYIEDIAPRTRDVFVQQARRFFSESNGLADERFLPVCMEKEVGHNFVNTLSACANPTTFVADLTVEECRKALVSAAAAYRHTKVPILFVDELTCYLTLQRLARQSALLFTRQAAVPRFYFGFSVSRFNRDLRKELDRASELYLQSDAPYIVERYLKMYWELVDFAAQLKEFSGNTWLAKKPQVWAKRICGLEPASTASALISRAWLPILDQVKTRIQRKSGRYI